MNESHDAGGCAPPVITSAPRRIYRTAQIKPATRDAIKDVLAQAADSIIRKSEEVEDRERAAATYRDAATTALAELKQERELSWWARAARGILRLWTGIR